LPAGSPAGARYDAAACCRWGPVRSCDAGGPVHRPGDADGPAAAAAVRAGHPQFLRPAPRQPVRLPGADAAGDRAVRRRHPALHRCAPAGAWSGSRRGQGKDQVAREYLAGHHGGGVHRVRRRGPGEEPGGADRAAPGPGDREAVPVAVPAGGDGRPLAFLRFRRRFRPVPYHVLRLFPFTGQIYVNGHEDARQQCRKEGIAVTGLDNAVGTVSGPAAAPADLRRADRSEDLPVRRHVAGPAAAAVHPRRPGRRLPLAAAGRAGRVLRDHGPGPAGERADLLPGS